jgi:hypothetical protein
MREYVDRETVRRLIDSPRSKEQMLAVFNGIHIADVRENIHAQWEWDPDDEFFFCTHCKIGFKNICEKAYDYCPNCGSRMDGEQS